MQKQRMLSRKLISKSLLLPLLLGTLVFVAVFLYLSPFDTLTIQQLVMQSIDVTPFKKIYVHFDLKGAAPKVDYILQIIPFLKRLNVDGLLIEYEDTFPYTGPLMLLRSADAYSEAEIIQILETAKQNELEVVPLIQTFGHLEFVLKHDQFAELREDPIYADTVCPSNEKSSDLINEILKQIRRLHSNSSAIHIGADEAYHVAKDAKCLTKIELELRNSTDRLKLWHIARTARQAQRVGFQEVWAWNDMFGDIDADLMKEYEMGKLVKPVVWGYARNVAEPGYFPPGMFKRYAKVFDSMFFGSAFKGANGVHNSFLDVRRYLDNQKSYMTLYKSNNTELYNRVNGIILTGWQRYNHFAPLCELLPVGIPSLVLVLHYLSNPNLSFRDLITKTWESLGCSTNHVEHELNEVGNSSNFKTVEATFMNGRFPGNEVFDLVEELRELTAKVENPPNSFSARYMLHTEILNMEKKVRSVFEKFFHKQTINEFLLQNLTPLKLDGSRK